MKIVAYEIQLLDFIEADSILMVIIKIFLDYEKFSILLFFLDFISYSDTF